MGRLLRSSSGKFLRSSRLSSSGSLVIPCCSSSSANCCMLMEEELLSLELPWDWALFCLAAWLRRLVSWRSFASCFCFSLRAFFLSGFLASALSLASFFWSSSLALFLLSSLRSLNSSSFWAAFLKSLFSRCLPISLAAASWALSIWIPAFLRSSSFLRFCRESMDFWIFCSILAMLRRASRLLSVILSSLTHWRMASGSMASFSSSERLLIMFSTSSSTDFLISSVR